MPPSSYLTSRRRLAYFDDGFLNWGASVNANFQSLDADHAGDLQPLAQVTPDMTLSVSSGIVYFAGANPLYFATGSSPTFTAPATNPRVDLLSLTSSGALTITQGAESVSPVPPAYPTANIPICEVYLRVGSTRINQVDAGANGYIYRDVRPFVRLAGAGGGSTGVTSLKSSNQGGTPSGALTGDILLKSLNGSGISIIPSIADGGFLIGNTGVIGLNSFETGSPLTGQVRLYPGDGIKITRDVANNAIRIDSAVLSETLDLGIYGDANVLVNHVKLEAGSGITLTRNAGHNSVLIASSLVGTASLKGRTAVRTVAASDSDANSKDGADFVCTGTNDQNTINTALASLPVFGGNRQGDVYLAPGTYNLTGSILLQFQQILRGAGRTTILKVANSVNADLNVIARDPTYSAHVVLIEDLMIDGNSANQTTGTMHGIYFAGAAGVIVRNVYIKNMRTSGVVFDSNCSKGIVDSCQIEGCGQDGIQFTGGSSSCAVTNFCLVNSNGRDGVRIDANAILCAVNISHIYQNTGQGILLDAATQCNLVGNICRLNSGSGIRLQNTSQDNNIVGCVCHSNVQEGLLIVASSYNQIAGGHFVNNTLRGVHIGVTSFSNAINGAVTRINHDTGLYIEGDNNVVTGCTISGNVTYGVYISGNYNVVSGGIVSASGDVQIQVGVPSSTGSFNKVTGVVVVNGQKDGIVVGGIQDNTVENNTLYANGLSGVAYVHIRVGATTYALVAGNKTRKAPTGINNTLNAIVVMSGASNTRVYHNDIHDGGTSTLFADSGSFTVTSLSGNQT